MLRIRNIFLCSILLSCVFAVIGVYAAPASDLGGASFDQVQQAAINGDPDAEYALGYMYYYGKGVTRDAQAATMWIQKAAVQGQPQAIKAARLLGLAANPDAGSTVTQAPPQSNNTATVSKITQQPPASAASTPTTVKAESNVSSKTDAAASKAAVVSQNMSNRSVDEKRLLSTETDYYTIQLLGSHNKQEILDFIKAHRLEAKALYYKTSYQGQPWYVLVYGLYKTDAAATAAVKQLPEAVQRLTPWVKSINTVQQGIRSGVE